MISTMSIKHVLLIFLFIVFKCAYSQPTKNIKLTIQPYFGDLEFKLNQNYYQSSINDSIQIETLKFYISGIELLDSNNVIWKEKNSYHLIDFENENSQSIQLHIPKNSRISKLKFNIGIDSITSNSGALDGDLDPTKGMYWAWQSGYINLKMEGTSPICETRKHQFQFHLGGYKQPFYAMQSIALPISIVKDNTVQINFNLAPIFNSISLKETHSIMIPCKDGMNVSKVVAQLFSIHAR
jgi:hypothetical protein